MSGRYLALVQFRRFATVGLVSNGILYLGYLLLTWFGVGAKLAMTILFALGVIQTFVFNKNWSFAYRHKDRRSFVRYLAAYLSAYCLNLILLVWLVDILHWPHQVVQGAAIIGLALYLFALQKFWVFRSCGQDH